MANHSKSICLRFLNGKDLNKQQLTCLRFNDREELEEDQTEKEENKAFQLLKEGDESSLTKLEESFEKSKLFNLSDTEIKSYQLSFIKQVTLAKQAAIQAGVDPQVASTINDYFVHQMLKQSTIPDIFELHQQMMAHYYEQIKVYQAVITYPRDIQKALHYIDQHLHQKISLKEVAAHSNYSPNYFSNYFKKELGISLSHYINQRKIQVAQNMLTYSDFSISEIASYLDYSSESYFIKNFKAVTGLTPKKFKESL